MKKIKLFLPFLIILTFFAISLNIAMPQVAKAKTYEWAMYTIMPAAGYFGQGFDKFAKMVEKESNSALKIKIHYGGALGYKASELLPIIKKRMVDIAELQLMKNDGTEKFLGINSLPFIVKDMAEAHWLDIISQPYYNKAVNRWNGKLLFSAILILA